MQVVITSYDMMWRLTCPFCCAGGSAARKGRASAKDVPSACLGPQVLSPLATWHMSKVSKAPARTLHCLLAACCRSHSPSCRAFR